MNSFVRCLVMLTYTLVIYRLDTGRVMGYQLGASVSNSPETFITKEFCEKRVEEAKVKMYGEESGDWEYDEDWGSLYKYKLPLKELGAMCFPTKDLGL